jgi:hypothetical protein
VAITEIRPDEARGRQPIPDDLRILGVAVVVFLLSEDRCVPSA